MVGRSARFAGARWKKRNGILVIDDGGGVPSTETGYMFPREANGSITPGPFIVKRNTETIFYRWKAVTGQVGEDNEVLSRWRLSGDNEWHAGYPSQFDNRTSTQANYKVLAGYENEYRGFHSWLPHDQSYVVECMQKNTGEFITFPVTLHPWMPPLGGGGLTLSGNSGTARTFTASGTKTAYIPIDLNGYMIDVNRLAQWVLQFGTGARYYCLMNGRLRGGTRDIVQFLTRVDNDVDQLPLFYGINIECSNWGDADPTFTQFGRNYCSSFHGITDWLNPQGRVHLREWLAEDPAFRSNYWNELGPQNNGTSNHPNGPQAVSFDYVNPDQGTISVYNLTTRTSNNKVFNDGLGGSQNRNRMGFPGHYSDIARCRITNVADDSIEAEGTSCCLLIRDNFSDNFYTGGSSAPIGTGPYWYMRNVSYASRTYDPTSSPSNPGGTNTKAAGHKNRTNQAWNKPHSNDVAAPTGFIGGGQGHFLFNTWPRLPSATNKTTYTHKGVRIVFETASGDLTLYKNATVMYNIASGFDRAFQGMTDPSNKVRGNVYTGTAEIPSGSTGNISGLALFTAEYNWHLTAGSPGKGSAPRVLGIPDLQDSGNDPGAWQPGITPLYGKQATI